MTVSLFSGEQSASLAGGIHATDLERLAKNLAAYTLAVVGDNDALQYLRARSGRFGTIPVAAIPGVNATADAALNGWATENAREDAYAKYQGAITQRKDLGETLVGIGAAAGGLSAGLIAEGTALQTSALPDWVLWGGVGVIALILLRRGR